MAYKMYKNVTTAYIINLLFLVIFLLHKVYEMLHTPACYFMNPMNNNTL